MDQSSRVLEGENRRRSGAPAAAVAMRPESIWTIIQRAMSVAVALTPPAAFVLSLAIGATARTTPFTSACLEARLPLPAASEWRTVLDVIPTGARMRVRTNSSQLV